MHQVGQIRLAAYVAGGHMSADSGYADILRDLGADGVGQVLVAESHDGDGNSRIVGTVMLQPWPHAGQVVTGPDEAEMRALAVSPDSQASGIGGQLVEAIIALAVDLGIAHLVLLTTPDMRAAHRLYERAGFARLPGRDWSPEPDVNLLAYGLRLAADGG